MIPFSEQLKSIDTHGFKCVLADHDALMIDDPRILNAVIHVHQRPHYCDRGRYGTNVYSRYSLDAKNKPGIIMSLDSADGFPRYFFSLQRLFDELYDWTKFNSDRLTRKTL